MQLDGHNRWPSFILSRVDSRDVAGVMLRMVVVIVVVVEVWTPAAVLRSNGGLGVEEAVNKLLLLTLAANLKEGICRLDTCVPNQ